MSGPISINSENAKAIAKILKNSNLDEDISEILQPKSGKLPETYFNKSVRAVSRAWSQMPHLIYFAY